MSLLLAAGGGATTYTYTASGGIVTGGAGLVSKTKDYPVTGGATTSGAAALAKTKDYPVSGGATTSGAAALAKTKNYPATGGAVASGTAALAKTKDYLASGGIITGGAATYSKTKDYSVSGGATTSGAASTALQAAAPAATGGGRVLRPLFIPRRPIVETATVYTYVPAGGVYGGVYADGSASTEHVPASRATTRVAPTLYAFEGRAAVFAGGAAGTERHDLYAQARAEDEEILLLLAA